MEFTFALGFLGLAILVVGSLAVGVVLYVFGEPTFNYEWAVTAIAAFIGGFAASEFVIAFRDYEPVFDGLAIVPALIGGVVLGGIIAAATRYLTRAQLSAETR